MSARAYPYADRLSTMHLWDSSCSEILLSFAWVREGPVTMVCQAMKAGGTEEILTVERLCTGRVGLFTFAGYPAAVAESEKVLSPLHYTTGLDTSHNHVTRSHHTTVCVCVCMNECMNART